MVFTNTSEYPSTFDDVMLRNTYEELKHVLNKSEELFERQRESLDRSSKNMELVSQRALHAANYEGMDFSPLNASLNDIKLQIEQLSKETVPKAPSFYSNSNNQTFIRELFHFLITPLSQIETKTIIFNQDPHAAIENLEQLKRNFSTIKTCVEICKSVLSAYREVSFVSQTSDNLIQSLNDGVIAAANLYKESMGKDVAIQSNLPNNFKEYTNNYLLAILLPLIENAIKASPQSALIEINYGLNESGIRITIKNEALQLPTIEQLKTPGYSSKKDHSGSGVTIVRHLVEDQNKGRLEYLIEGKSITAVIIIPNRTKL